MDSSRPELRSRDSEPLDKSDPEYGSHSEFTHFPEYVGDNRSRQAWQIVVGVKQHGTWKTEALNQVYEDIEEANKYAREITRVHVSDADKNAKLEICPVRLLTIEELEKISVGGNPYHIEKELRWGNLRYFFNMQGSPWGVQNDRDESFRSCYGVMWEVEKADDPEIGDDGEMIYAVKVRPVDFHIAQSSTLKANMET